MLHLILIIFTSSLLSNFNIFDILPNQAEIESHNTEIKTPKLVRVMGVTYHETNQKPEMTCGTMDLSIKHIVLGAKNLEKDNSANFSGGHSGIEVQIGGENSVIVHYDGEYHVFVKNTD